ncbi:unnamed protein product [Cyprideis torosa]|uniref:RING-type E3 ubiquitin transferase n=1 Tax=Cyprideis torosa TaxID=163714 RepID=A0A7R8ZTI0_9CRUS|nr:unnamed protein product [Cyprideis torosa]CAG0904080.1 unnamed protein product [Cyprideis torosa]
MGNYWTTRRSSGVEEINLTQQYQYRYPPRDGSNYFASHFIMGGERFDMPQAEGYLFGENSDLNFLGSRPAPFPYSAPQSHEPTKTLNALINVRKESLRFVKIQPHEQSAQTPGMENEDGVGSCSSPDLTSSMISAGKTATVLDAVATGPPSLPSGTSTSNSNFLYCSSSTQDVSAASSNKKIKSIDKKGASTSSTSLLQNTNGGTASSVLSSPVSNKKKSSSIQIPQPPPPTPAPNNTKFNIEFTFDADAKCAITIHYFCIEELSPYGVFYTPRDHRMSSETYRFKKGANQVFSQATHIFDPTEWPEEDLSLSMEMKEVFPVVIHCIAEEGEGEQMSYRYQASNCPICRAPFRALLQIRAVQKGETSTSTCSEPTSSSHQPASTTASSTRVNIPQIPAGVESPPSQQGIPTGYEVVSLLEALNGPPPTPPPTPSFSASKPRR